MNRKFCSGDSKQQQHEMKCWNFSAHFLFLRLKCKQCTESGRCQTVKINCFFSISSASGFVGDFHPISDTNTNRHLNANRRVWIFGEKQFCGSAKDIWNICILRLQLVSECLFSIWNGAPKIANGIFRMQREIFVNTHSSSRKHGIYRLRKHRRKGPFRENERHARDLCNRQDDLFIFFFSPEKIVYFCRRLKQKRVPNWIGMKERRKQKQFCWLGSVCVCVYANW